MRFLLVATIISIFTMNSCSEPEYIGDITKPIPKPQQQEIAGGFFVFPKTIKVYSQKDFSVPITHFKNFIENNPGFKVVFVDDTKKADLVFKIDSTTLNKEAYKIEVKKEIIEIASSTSNGAFYAFQTIRQLLPGEFEKGLFKENSISIPCQTILDEPKFSYRGMHLDVSRHFFSAEEVKTYIDYLALLKYNTFHWHLTEDQGWRIEIKQFPRLTEIGGYRNETLVGHYSDQPHQFDGKKYGGFYTQEEVREIVQYASDRFITVIPEIEMPGHALAALSAYPEYGCVGESYEAATKWGVFEDVFCAKDDTFDFLEAVLDEVIELFPSSYIHIGGDEVPKTRWKSCDNCQKIIKREQLKDEHELQSYFITRIENYLNSKGKNIIGWDEILEGGLAPNATVMSWRGTEGAIEAAKLGHKVILTPNSHVYFDHYQSKPIEKEPLAIGGYSSLENVYGFDPIPEELSEEQSKLVLGGQGNVWTEYMPNFEKVEYMVFPRAIALSEVLWTYNNRDYNDFVKRLADFDKRMEILEINYFKTEKQ